MASDMELRAATAGPDELRHPRERHIAAVVTVIDVLLVVAVIALLVAGTEWLTSMPSMAKYKGEAKLLLLAVIGAPVMAVYVRRRRRKLALEESIRVSPDQLPDIHRVLVSYCARVGIPVPELYLSDSVEDATTFCWRGHHCIIVPTHEFSIFSQVFEEIIAWVLAREVGRICLGHASFRNEVLASSIAPIPFLRAPLNQAWTYSRDRYGAFLAPHAARALFVAAAGDRLCNEVNLDTYFAQLDEIHDQGFWLSALWPMRKKVPLAYRMRELRRAGMLVHR